jgi:Transglutaminase-like superfamily
VTALLRKIRRFRQLQPDQKKTFLIAVALLPWFWLGLRVFGFAWMQSFLIKNDCKVVESVDLTCIRRAAEAVNLAARRGPFPFTCLTRSMLLHWFLRRGGVPSELRLGVRIEQGAFSAHAWVECSGVPVNDDLDIGTRFAPFCGQESPVQFDK